MPPLPPASRSGTADSASSRAARSRSRSPQQEDRGAQAQAHAAAGESTAAAAANVSDFDEEEDFSSDFSSSELSEELDAAEEEAPLPAAVSLEDAAAAINASSSAAAAQAALDARAAADAEFVARHSSVPVAAARHRKKAGFAGPSASLQRQVAEAQAAAVQLAKQREKERRIAAGLSPQSEQPLSPASAASAASTVTAGSATDSECMQVWGRVASVLSLAPTVVSAAAGSSDGSLVATACGRAKGAVHVWAQPQQQLVAVLNAAHSQSTAATLAGSGHAHGGVVLQAPVSLLRFTPYSPFLARAQPASRGYALLAASEADQGTIVVWSLATGKACLLYTSPSPRD